MMIQNQINRTLNAPESRALLEQILLGKSSGTRSAVGRSVCEAFGFVDVRGRFQLAGCLKTLRKLADTGAIVLPAAQRGAPSSIPRRLVGSLPAASEVPGRLEAVGKLGLFVVESRDERQVWNTMIGDEHPRGMTTFAGCQMRYLFASSHGYLGAAGFSASALRLSARDRWMAWSDEQRKQALNRVVCMSRTEILFFSPCWRLPIFRNDFGDRFGGQDASVVLKLVVGEIILSEQVEMPP